MLRERLTEKINVSVTKKMADTIADIAEQEGVSRGDVIRACLENDLEKLRERLRKQKRRGRNTGQNTDT